MENLDIWVEYGFTDTSDRSDWQKYKSLLLALERAGQL
jgi:hypothetical protein